MTEGSVVGTAVVYPTGSLDDIRVEVTEQNVERGYIEFECPACEGTGVAFWHPAYPGREGPGCIECSTRGTRCASV